MSDWIIGKKVEPVVEPQPEWKRCEDKRFEINTKTRQKRTAIAGTKRQITAGRTGPAQSST